VRPKTIVYFEWTIFGTLLLGALQNYLAWDQVIAQAPTLDRNTAVVLILAVMIFTYVLVGTLTLLVSRRRSKIAMWVSVALFALGFALFVFDITRGVQIGTVTTFALGVLQSIGQGVAYGILFTPPSRRWMRREDEKLREVFH
jgi:hypothetical protein